MKEIWLPVVGYENKYLVSNFGKVKSLSKYSGSKTKILKHHIVNGYHNITLVSECQDIKRYGVHRLVAMAFIPNPNNYPCVHHIDENKANNKVSNLMWCTYKQNLEFSNVIEKMQKAGHKACEKAVLMYDNKGNFVREFESATKAAAEINSKQQYVSLCCYGKRETTRGYCFKFK